MSFEDTYAASVMIVYLYQMSSSFSLKKSAWLSFTDTALDFRLAALTVAAAAAASPIGSLLDWMSEKAVSP